MWDIKTVGNKALFGAKWIGISAALGYGVLQYAKHKWIQVIKEKGMIMAAQSHLKTRFELNIKDIEFTAENQIIALKDHVFAEFNVEELTAILRNQSSDGFTNDQVKETKIKLWNQIKVFAFTRMILGIYLLVLHAEFTAVLISIFGRLDYLDSLDRQSSTTLEDIFDDEGLPLKDPSQLLLGEPFISDDTRRRFLTISWYIIHIGWKNISGTVYNAVQMIIQE